MTARCIAVLALSLLAGCAGTLAPTAPVVTTVTHRLAVSTDCHARPACFGTVQTAVDAAGTFPTPDPVTIAIGRGNFKERVEVRRANVALVGAGRGATRIYNDLVAETAGRYHRDHWGTPGSATLVVDADGVTVRGLTIENTFDYLANDALAAGAPGRIANHQAVAVLLDIHSDRVLMEDVALLGYQDTLFANGRRGYIRNALIAGNVDFIFGNGQLLIEDSELRTRRRAKDERDNGFQSFLLAPSTQLSQPFGIVVHRSRLTREAGVPDASVALARPWHPTSRFADGRYADPAAVGQALFIDCWMDRHIGPRHWTSMQGTARDGTKTAIFTPQTSRFWETNAKGPGARHEDIGMSWRPALSWPQMRARFFAGWPQA
ncbi:pectinesterase family protein [Parablastomonas sp. CN1-191]|uniref:pectinesterase family protein n=1 Tax=Parablastomonas sp. CN1-191 TaxID=3400908 RepID=UPI003BF7FB6F